MRVCILLLQVSSDNGGPSDDQMGDSFGTKHIDRNVASNHPLRGKKASVWEGGTRVLGIVNGVGIQGPGSLRAGLMHAVDWAPTLLAAAGASEHWLPGASPVDGVSVWPMLSVDAPSPRADILNNINQVTGGAALRSGRWKIVLGSGEAAMGGWYGGVAGLRRGTPAVAGAGVQCGTNVEVTCNPGSTPCLFDLENGEIRRLFSQACAFSHAV